MQLSREAVLGERVEDVSTKKILEIAPLATKLVKIYETMGGFSSRYVAEAVKIMKEMLMDRSCTVFLAFTANLVATGLRGVISSFINTGVVDAIVTTGGTFDHDIARALGHYYKGDFELDDSMLMELDVHRLGNVLVPKEGYGPVVEGFSHRIFEELITRKTRWTPSELAREIGLRLKDENSVLVAAAKTNIPVFSPGVIDSAFGTSLFTFNEIGRSRGFSIELDVIGDMAKIADIVMESERLGAIVLGGGISKHHVIWWAQFKGGLDYAVYVTTASELDGSLSGARTREAISWGKLKPSAKHVNVPADATLVFPIIVAALMGELK
ncbi:MAG: deoxyhypusine synthase [Thermofilaceae archaeon]|nr:deoxyhypusine synthase [Thermofilaceae archaeon]